MRIVKPIRHLVQFLFFVGFIVLFSILASYLESPWRGILFVMSFPVAYFMALILSMVVDDIDLSLRRWSKDPGWLISNEGQRWLESEEGIAWKEAGDPEIIHAWASEHFPEEVYREARYVAEMLPDILGISLRDIKPQSKFIEDLDAVELEPVEIVLAIEQELQIELPDEDAEKLATVSDMVHYLHERTDTTWPEN